MTSHDMSGGVPAFGSLALPGAAGAGEGESMTEDALIAMLPDKFAQ